MTEALAEIIRFGLEKLELNKIRCLTLPKNTRSMSLHEAGFKKEGMVREHTDAKGKLLDDVLFSITRRELASMELPH